MNKIIFPFYSSLRHNFLIKKWWIRTLIVVYASIFLISIPTVWISDVTNIRFDAREKCLDTIKFQKLDDKFRSASGGYDFKSFFESPESKLRQEEIENCEMAAQKIWFAPIVFKNAIIIPLIIHYMLQLIFFKIIIDFIVLGSRVSKNND